jgi:hypothetical protein
MNLFLSVTGALILGYLIPVLASLFFSLFLGGSAPRMLHQNGRIQLGFMWMHGAVWLLASAVSGYEMARMVPDVRLRMLTCGVGGVILIIALLGNMDEMKKRQSPMQIGGMILATIGGIAAGLEIYLKMTKTV